MALQLFTPFQHIHYVFAFPAALANNPNRGADSPILSTKLLHICNSNQ